jgi:outer membrane receptor protein involved in Fe transport
MRIQPEAVVAIILAFTAQSGFAVADTIAPSYTFDTAGQPLSDALKTYAHTTNQQIIFTEDLVMGFRAPALKGEYTADAALNQLLHGTGLTVERSPSGALMIKRPGMGGGAKPVTYASDATTTWRVAQSEPPAQATASAPGESSPSASSRESGSTSDVPRADSVQEVVVTAQKRAEPLQRVPISVSVIDSNSIDRRNVGDFSQFADSVPGVTFATTGVGNSQFYIRGIGAVAQDQSPTTGVYLDETPLQSRSMRGISQPDPQLFDVQRVEVLRGPQGVLYGSSAMGGLIRIITNPPDPNRFVARLEGSGAKITDGNESWDAKGMVNIPLADDKLGLRVAGVLGHQGGWIDDLRPTGYDLLENLANPSAIHKNENSADYGTIRATLKWSPSDTLSITPGILYQDTDSNTDRYESDADYGLEGRTKARYIDTFFKDRSMISSVVIDKKLEALGGMSVLSSSSYMDRDTQMMFDATPYWAPLVEAEVGVAPDAKLYPVGLYDVSNTKQFTEELRLVSTSSAPLQFAVGAFFKHLRQRWDRTGPVFDLFGATPTGPFAASDPANLSDTLNRFTEDEYALFGEVTHAFSDQWQLAVGGRGLKYKQRDARRRFEQGGPAGGILTYDFAERNTEKAFTPRVTLSYRPAEQINLYASFSEGLRAGGTNAPIPDTVCTPEEREAAGLPDVPPPYGSDKTKNYELGAKTQWLERRLRINGAIYAIDWNGYQQNVQTVCGANQENSVFFIANAGKVRSKGGELEIDAAVTSHFSLSLAASSTDATYRNAVIELGLPAGSRLLDVPKFTWSVTAEYGFMMGPAWLGDVMLSSRHVGRSDSGFGEGTLLARPAYTLLDLNLSARKDDLTISLYVNNLTDKVPVFGQEYATAPDTTSAQSYFAYLVGPPRTMGLKVSKNF